MNKTVVIRASLSILLLFILCECAYSQKIDEDSLSMNERYNLYQFPEKEYFVTIPYTDINGKMIVELEINGKNLKCIFDTGAMISLFKKSIIEELDFPVMGWNIVKDLNGISDTVNTYLVSSMNIKDIQLSNIPAMTIEESVIFDCFGVDGIIGFDLFLKSVFRISSSDKSITVTNNPSKLDLKEEYSNQLFYLDGARPAIMVRFINANKNIHGDDYLMIDTGYDGFVAIPTLAYKERYEASGLFDFISENDSGSNLSLLGKFEDTETRNHINIHELKIVQTSFTDIDIKTGRGGTCLLGSALLDHGIMTIDNINTKFYYESFEQNISLKSQKGSIETFVTDGKMIITDIYDENLKTQLNVGDRILAIDEYDCRNVNECDILKNFLIKGKKKAVFEIEDGLTKDAKSVEIELNH